MEQQLKKLTSDNSLIEKYSELPSQNSKLQDLYFDLNKRVLNMINDIGEKHLAKTQKLEELIEIVKTDIDVNKIENPQTNNVVMLGNKLNFNELNSSYSAEITTIPLGAEYSDTFISGNDERGEIVMKDDIPAIEIIQSINNKLDDMRKETKKDISDLKGELKTDINKTDIKMEKISENIATININLAKIATVNSIKNINKKNIVDRFWMVVSILVVFLVDKFVH